MTDYLIWQVEINTPNTILVASNLQERHCLSFWDAMIIAAARQGGANILLTEDLNHGQIIEGIRIQNPFLNSKQPTSGEPRKTMWTSLLVAISLIQPFENFPC